MATQTARTHRLVARYRGNWGILVTMWLLAFSVTAFQILPAGILPVVRADLAIGATAAGWLVSASLAAQALGNLPVGVAIDRTSNRTMVALAAVAMLVSGVWAWQAGEAGAFWSLIAAIALGGVAIAAIITGGANMIGAAFPGENEASAVAAFTAAAPSGYAVGQFTGPRIAEAFGWPTNFLVYGLLAFVAFVLFWGSGREVDLNPEGATPPSLGDFRRLFANRHVWLVALMSFVAYSLYLLFNSWMPSYLNEEFGLALVASGAFAALFPAIGIVARTSGGLVSDRLFDRRRRPVALTAFAVSVPLVVLIALVGVPVVLALLLVPAGFFVQLCVGLFYTYVREVANPAVTGTALAMLGLVSFAGAFSAPVVAGALIDATGSFTWAFGYAVLLALVGVGLALVAPEPNLA